MRAHSLCSTLTDAHADRTLSCIYTISKQWLAIPLDIVSLSGLLYTLGFLSRQCGVLVQRCFHRGEANTRPARARSLSLCFYRLRVGLCEVLCSLSVTLRQG